MARRRFDCNSGIPLMVHQERSDDGYLADMIAGPYPVRSGIQGAPGIFPYQALHICTDRVMEQSFPDQLYNMREPSSISHNADSPQNLRNLVSKQIAEGPMERWVRNNPDEAWSVPRVVPPLPLCMENRPQMRHSAEFLSLTCYRDSGQSDISSVVSGQNQQLLDSGYGTAPATHSVVGSETGKICPQILNLSEAMQPFPRFSRPSSSLGLPTTPDKGYDHFLQSVQRDFQCSGCDEVLRLPSQLKKHKLKHEKPYKCDVVGCARLCGFATPNDLDRHKRSKHGLNAGCGPLRYWQCAAQACTSKNKIWPRLDNFRQHVERMHKEENSPSLIRRSGRNFQQDTTSFNFLPDFSIRGGSASENTQLLESDVQVPYWSPLEWSDPFANIGGQFAADVAAQFSPPTALVDPTSATVTSQFTTVLSPTSCSSIRPRSRQGFQVQPNPVCATSLSLSIDSALLWPSLPRSTGEKRPHINVNDLQESQRSHRRCGRSSSLRTSKGVELHTSHSQLCLPVNDLSHTSNTSHIRKSAISGPDGLVVNGIQCPEPSCGKVVRRNCDLRKHKRRHTRPFACTFDSCGTSPFGSKNDWKRHENLQHPQTDLWRCGICRSLYGSEENFVMHLLDQHGYLDNQCLANECNFQRISTSGQQFWCGFCREIKYLEAAVSKTSDERFDHICKHFIDEERNIKDWLPASGTRTKGEIDAAFKEYAQSTVEQRDFNLLDRKDDAISPKPTFQTCHGSACKMGLICNETAGRRTLEGSEEKRHLFGNLTNNNYPTNNDSSDYNLCWDSQVFGMCNYCEVTDTGVLDCICSEHFDNAPKRMHL